ncbi:MAG: 5-(carboxyamino)imidazole ribonucleotide synthase [Phycisphaerales bacterium]|nr:5-(carboxyamino)imidazole ribonucleotide synthase [Phycisphaerales bacterium]
MSAHTIGIIGGGQLAQMLAQSVKPMGIKCIVLDPNPKSCAQSDAELVVAEYTDAEALGTLAQRCDVVTYEFENVPAKATDTLVGQISVHPNPEALRVSQDRLNERTMFAELGIDTPRYEAIDSLDDLFTALETIGAPALLKARTLGYDGKGQVLVSDASHAEESWSTLGKVPAILDAFVPFVRELSVVAVRAQSGGVVFYPLAENVHRGGILRVSKAPARGVNDRIEKQARDAATSILNHLDYVGVLAVEFFQIGAGDDARLVANEIAPRVHNTGHWTIEGARTSQFENHMRAVMGMELGSTDPIGCSAMVNIIGDEPRPGALEAVPEAHVHMYGKAPRAGRKIGHVTLNTPNETDLDALLERFTRVVG